MPALSQVDERNISRAFELAFFIIPDKTIAMRIVEEAWCSLDVTAEKRDRSRRTYDRLLGYVKGEERSRPFRTKIRLYRSQMLQWLVYAVADSWERATEYGDGIYSPRMEDMVVRYVKHLVRITTSRNSFYVTLGITRLVYEYGTQEVRLMYDVLTASDTARMKDPSYLRRRKSKLMEEILTRFDGMLHVVVTGNGRRRFDSQPTTERWIELVKECLTRFTPWDTTCPIPERFDPTAVSDLYFSGAHLAHEDRIETSRIHTILHPDCFLRFINGLSQFVQKLPSDSPDKNCKFNPPDDMLSIPNFHGFQNKDSSDDRFDPPKLQPEDYHRLERSREMLARRRKDHKPHRLCVRVDDVDQVWIDPKRSTRVELDIDQSHSVLEVLGEDSDGLVRLALTMVYCEEAFRESVMLEAGQKVTIEIEPIKSSDGEVERARVAVSYIETKVVRLLSLRAKKIAFAFSGTLRHPGDASVGGNDYSWLGKAGLAFALTVAVIVLIVSLQRSPRRDETAVISEGPSVSPQVQPGPSVEPSALPERSPAPVTPKPTEIVARASWSQTPEAARQAIRLEVERGESTKVEIPADQGTVSIALPQLDAGKQAYSHYRVALVVSNKTIWVQTLGAPRVDVSRHAHVLNIPLPPRNQIKVQMLLLKIEAKINNEWRPLGGITLDRSAR